MYPAASSAVLKAVVSSPSDKNRDTDVILDKFV